MVLEWYSIINKIGVKDDHLTSSKFFGDMTDYTYNIDLINFEKYLYVINLTFNLLLTKVVLLLLFTLLITNVDLKGCSSEKIIQAVSSNIR